MENEDFTMPRSAVLKLKDGLVFRQTTADLCMAFDKENGVMYEFNDTASFFLQKIDGARSLEDIIGLMTEAYEVSKDEVVSDMSEILGRLVKTGLLQFESK